MSLEHAWRAYCAAAEREERDLARHPGRYPHYATDGRWTRVPLDVTSGWTSDSSYDHGNWTGGFSAGVAWLRRIGDADVVPSPQIRALVDDLEPRAEDGDTHDLGFLFYPSYVVGAITGALDDGQLAPARRAAQTLAGRFRPSGGFIQAFGSTSDPRSAGTSTIDTMMNLPLLWWAGRNDEAAATVAHRHALTSARCFFRDDGSTFHLIRFDPDSGQLAQRGTFQGASDKSCWSRGQAWAIAGFAWAYAATGDDALLAAAERAWRYFRPRIPADGVVPWDFTDDTAGALGDASASAIAAVGLAILATTHPSADRRSEYDASGTGLLEMLAASAVSDGREEGILLRSCYSKPHGLGLRGATPWGDFYYGLALALTTRRITVDALLSGVLQRVEAAR